MRVVAKTLAGLLPGLALTLALTLTGCSSEEVSLTLEVSASPNPVAGTADGDGRRWDYRVEIVNPTAVPVVVEYYHTEITGTDTGYTQPLQVVRDSEIVGRRVGAGGSAAYDANRSSGGKFSSGRERRIYHARGDDGEYYSGEVTVDLR